MATIKKVKKYQTSGPPLTVTRAGKFSKKTFETDTSGYAAGKKSFPTKVTTVGINKKGEETPLKNSPYMMNVRRGAVEEQLGQREKMKKQMEEKAKGKMKMGGKMKKAAMGVTTTSETTKKPIKDSSNIYRRMGNEAAIEMSNAFSPVGMSVASNKIAKADKNLARQKLKGKPGYDAMGFPVKKQKMGGKVSKMMSKMKAKMSKKK